MYIECTWNLEIGLSLEIGCFTSLMICFVEIDTDHTKDSIDSKKIIGLIESHRY